MIVHSVDKHEPVGHQEIESRDDQVIHRLETRHAVLERDAVLGNSVHDTLDQSHDSEVLDSPAEATTVPEERAAQVLIAWDSIVSESGSLVSFLAHKTDTKVSRLDHVDVVGTVTDSKSDLVASELAHESDNLSLLARR